MPSRQSSLYLALAILLPVLLTLLILALVLMEWARARRRKMRPAMHMAQNEMLSSSKTEKRLQAIFFRPAGSFTGSLLHPKPVLISHRSDALADPLTSGYLFVHAMRKKSSSESSLGSELAFTSSGITA
jgi:hypothetical protein